MPISGSRPLNLVDSPQEGHPESAGINVPPRITAAPITQEAVMRFTRLSFRGAAIVVAAVGLTSAAALAASPAGAHSRADSDARLAAAMLSLDRSVAFAGTAWGVDAASNQVVVSVDRTITGSHLTAVRAAVQRLGSTARLQAVAGTFHLDISGGDAIYGTQFRCSLGFNVVSGSTHYFLTAGHCGKAEPKWWTSANHSTFLGNTTGATFPGKDYAIVKYDPSFTNYPGTVAGNHDIDHAVNAFVGETVTRTGSTTGTHSGRV